MQRERILTGSKSCDQVKAMVRGKDRRVELGYFLALQYRR